MSWPGWTEYCFGFSLDECDVESIANFLADKCGYADEREALLNSNNYFEMECNMDDPVRRVIAAKINEEMGTNIFAGFSADDAGHGDMVGVRLCYPWEIRGKIYTREECDEILKKYAAELGAGKDLENDEFEMEYGG